MLNSVVALAWIKRNRIPERALDSIKNGVDDASTHGRYTPAFRLESGPFTAITENRALTQQIVIKSDFDQFDAWRDAFAEAGIESVRWQDRHHHLDTIRYALVWQPGPGELAALPGLELVFSIGAGVDHLVGPDIVPPHLPVVRNVDPGLTAGMVEYVLYHVIRFHRGMAIYEQDQAERRWRPRLHTPARDLTVGVMGIGELGGACASALLPLGFRVAGWSRGPRDLSGIDCYHGNDALADFLAVCNVLVCLLPLTPETRGILDRRTLAMLPRGACLINVGRGPLVVEEDLLEALDEGRVGAATLDVFHTEPLPRDHSFWSHPGITVTPHVASITLPGTSALHMIDNIQRHREGRDLTHTADLVRGY